ncbi:MAG: hypothetical protein GSR82_03190 [Desulfurococcales archaeon]|nr:hypothetical protein [Desulfurococcales archaeon]
MMADKTLVERLPMYRTCGYRLGSHLKAVATAMTVIYLGKWSEESRKYNRHIWQLPLVGLLHDIGLAAPSYQDLLYEKCLNGEEPYSHDYWKITVAVLSYASCNISSMPLRRALGDSVRAVFNASTAKTNYTLRDLIDSIARFKKDDLLIPARYTAFVLKSSHRLYGIPREIAEAFNVNSIPIGKVVKCVNRTLSLEHKSPVQSELARVLLVADQMITSMENHGFSGKGGQYGIIYKKLVGLGVKDPVSLVNYVSRRVTRFYKTLKIKGGAAC